MNKQQRWLSNAGINSLMGELFNLTPTYNNKGVVTGWSGAGGFAQPDIYTGQQYLPGTAGTPATEGYWLGAGGKNKYATSGPGRTWVPGQEAVAGTQGQAISDILPSYLAQQDPQYMQMANQALQNLSGGLEDVFSPIYQQSQNLWQQQISPGIMEQFAGMGAAGSGGAQSALAREGQNLSTNLGATLAPLYLQAQQALPGLAQGVGSWQQGLAQQPLDVSKQIWSSAQPYSNPYMSMMSSFLPQSGQYQSPYLSQSSPSFGSQLLSGMGTNLAGSLGGSLGSLGGSLLGLLGLSDVRLKENFKIIENALEKIEQLEGQIFNFKGSSNRSAGIMAQDVEKVLPESVEEIDGKKYIKFDGVVALLVNAVRELNEKVDNVLQN